MGDFDVIALTPPGGADPALAIAACRAGARGFLDLEFVADPGVARAQIGRLERFTSSPFGVKVGRDGGPLLEQIWARPPARLAWILLAGGVHEELTTWVNRSRERGLGLLLEAVSLAEVQVGPRLGVDGLVLKGNEAGGRIGPDSAFILLQKWRRQRTGNAALPIWVQGGIGLHTAAACVAAGAAGVVLDAQLLLARESSLPDGIRSRLATVDGSETVCLGERLGEVVRVYMRPGQVAVEELTRLEQQLSSVEVAETDRRQAWRQAVRQRVQAGSLWVVGQDAALARRWAERFGTVAGMIQALTQSVVQHLEAARRLQPLAENSPLAVRHRTRFPIVQGPMTRVSDTAAFAAEVARNGALPFLALALMKRAETEQLLQETRARLGDRSWGAGILGFAPPEIRRDQIDAIRAIRPPFALIAGGRPDQARELENDGIPTYLHVPSPGLLQRFLRDGARRFIFEGRECGGHVGPRSSFVLWELMTEVLQDHIGQAGKADDLHILFAGGIHDAASAAMVAALAAGLAERGAGIGVLLGTAYLFTQEAVTSGAIVPQFQREALSCQETVLLETGPGHAIRCVPTPYAGTFADAKRRLLEEGRSADEVREALEAMNIGRLRVASKGIDRGSERKETEKAGFISLSEEEQRARGMYMIGQAATMRREIMPMAQLHQDICTGSTHLLEDCQTLLSPHATLRTPQSERPCDVAIVGMACVFPRAGSLRAYWENILARVDAVVEVPPSHWDWRPFYDANPKAADKISSRWGGFLDDVPFDPLVYGMPPSTLGSIEPMQLILLETVRRALADAGYADRPFDRDRTAVVLGAGGGAAQLAMAYGFRTYLGMLDSVPGLPRSGELIQQLNGLLPQWTEDSFPGILLNVAAGRVANRFNLGGPNFAVDAACGSSLAALYAAARELETGSSDTVVLMGADTVQNPFTYMLFSKTHAFSPRGRCRTFDETADGIVISEGIAAVILKRLADAERDGDRIYAVVKGVGASSDGRDKGLTAPRPEGQLRALRRAYARAKLSPARVGLVEAHGTGTVVGDQTEVQALGQVFREANAPLRSCAVGSVKSMIGHTKCAAGLAGLINAALALYHKVLPPTLVERPNSKANFDKSPFYLNTEPRPWVHGGPQPRCAGVSAFGFGGTNFHAVLEEYSGAYLETPAGLDQWPAELLVWCRPSREALVQAVQQCRDALARGARPSLRDLAYSVWKSNRAPQPQPTAAIVASSLDDLKQKLDLALTLLQGPDTAAVRQDPRGVFVSPEAPTAAGKVAFLFPGQGAQYPNMLAQLGLVFREVRQAFDDAEQALQEPAAADLACRLERPLGQYIFSPSAFTAEQEQEARAALTRTDVAQPAIGAASLGMLHLLRNLGVEPDFLAGHSYGDYVALCAAGALSEDDLIRLSYHRGRVILETTDRMPGGMAAVDADLAAVEPIIAGIRGITPANLNSPRQTVLSGTTEAIVTALARLQAQGIRGQRLPVGCGFHSPLMAAAREPFARVLARCRLAPPARPVYANNTAAPYPADVSALAGILADHLTCPVRFQAEIEALYAAGARLFVEVGPQAVLTGLVGQILAGQPHLAVASDFKGRPGLVQLQNLLGQLLVHGIPAQLDRLFEGREVRLLDLHRLDDETGAPKLPPSTWLVNSVRARPIQAPEPVLLGQAQPALDQAEGETGRRGDREKRIDPPSLGLPVSPSPRLPDSPSPQGQEVATNGLAQTAPPGDEAAQVMLRFQDLMARFLETQQSVMVQYLQGNGEPTAGTMSLPPLADRARETPAAVPPPKNGTIPEPAVPPPPPAIPEKAANGVPPAGANREDLTGRLLDIVRQRTGYPPEMLGLDLDLEADLGIDSIKRVEILGSLVDATPGNGGANSEMEKLVGIKTLRGIVDSLLAAHPGNGNGHAEPIAQEQETPRPFDDRAGIQRLLVVPAEARLPESAELVLPTGPVLITDEERGVAQALADQLTARGVPVVRVQMAAGAGPQPSGDGWKADLTDAQAVQALLGRIRAQVGPLAGLIHLLPLAEPPAGESWDQRVKREVQSLFLLCRESSSELHQASQHGHAVLLAAMALGGRFGTGPGPLPPDFFAGAAGVGGLVKSLAHEWPEALVRVVDVDAQAAAKPRALADRLLLELGDPEGPLEIGLEPAGRRITLQCVPAPLTPPANPAAELGPEAVILLTGGARGITAAIAERLAQRHRPHLVLVGRSPLPAKEETAPTAGLADPAAIKAALIAQMRQDGQPVAPQAVQAAYHRLLADREIRANLRRLEQAGARAHYRQADVRDEAAFGAVIDGIYEQFGRLDGVIHGAGVIQDKLIRDKSEESFDRVFGTKVDSALILSRRLRPADLRFCLFFASVAGRFGNRGQADYAAANEVLVKLAAQLDRSWPGRVAAIVWGPWSQIGMVAELEQHLGQRGLALIPPEIGTLLFEEELAGGRKGESEVVLAGDVGQLALRGPGVALVGANPNGTGHRNG